MSWIPRTRSQAAFFFSFQRLVDRKNRLFFWTFTAYQPMDDKQFAEAWHKFVERVRKWLRREGSEWMALRVFEPHMGGGARNGRAHAHMVIDVRLAVGCLKRLAIGTGIGPVMWVKRVRDPETLGQYLSKYCCKAFGLKNCRRWAAMSSSNLNGWHCGCKEVIADWEEARQMRALYEEYRGQPNAALMVAARMAQRRGLEEELGPVERVEWDLGDFLAVGRVNERARRLGASPNWRVAEDPLSKEFRRILLGEDAEGNWV